jgi:hypothetical protein
MTPRRGGPAIGRGCPVEKARKATRRSSMAPSIAAGVQPHRAATRSWRL